MPWTRLSNTPTSFGRETPSPTGSFDVVSGSSGVTLERVTPSLEAGPSPSEVTVAGYYARVFPNTSEVTGLRRMQFVHRVQTDPVSFTISSGGPARIASTLTLA